MIFCSRRAHFSTCSFPHLFHYCPWLHLFIVNKQLIPFLASSLSVLLFVTVLATKHLIALCQAANFLYPSGQGCFSMTVLINPVAPSHVQAGNGASPAAQTKGLADWSSVKPMRLAVGFGDFSVEVGSGEYLKLKWLWETILVIKVPILISICSWSIYANGHGAHLDFSCYSPEHL